EMIEPATADLDWEIGGEEADVAALAGDLQAQLARYCPLALNHRFVRIELLLDEAAHRSDDHLLLVGEAEVHGVAPAFIGVLPSSISARSPAGLVRGSRAGDGAGVPARRAPGRSEQVRA